MQAMFYTQHDICFVVGLVCSYQSNLGLADQQAFKRIKRYLRGIVNLIFYYHSGYLKMKGYSDVKWASDPDR